MAAPHLEVFGIRIRMDASWILLALLIAWTLASGVFPELYQGLASTAYWGMAAVAVFGIAVSIVLHELGHSLVAKAFGLPIRSITLFMFGGVAEMEEEPRSPWAELVMAIAGPMVSLALGVGFSAAALASGGLPREFAGVLDYLGTLNIMLAIFNLAPAFPLDGGRVLRAIIWLVTGDAYKATRIAARVGEVLGAALIAAGALTAIATRFASGLWWILLGWFIFSMARAHRREAEARRQLTGATVGDLMTRDPVTAPADMPVDAFVETVLARHPHDLFPVVDSGVVIGGVGFKEAQATPTADRARLQVGDIATPLAAIPIAASSEPVDAALERMQRLGASRALVIDDRRLTGVLTLKDVMNHLRFRSAFPQGRPAEA